MQYIYEIRWRVAFENVFFPWQVTFENGHFPFDFLKPLDIIPVAICISVKRFTCIHALLYVYKDFISFVRCNDKLNFTFKIKHAWPPPDNYGVYFHFKLTCLFLIFVVFV